MARPSADRWEARGPDRPNVLLIMADQHRGDCIGANGNAVVQTPHLDRLAASGACFTHGYSESPVCMPARAMLMTGQLPFTSGVVANGQVLPADAPTLASALAAAGYFTQAIGKMHFRPVRTPYGLQRMWLSEEIPSHIEEDEFVQDLIAAGYGHVEEPHGVRHELYFHPQVSQLPETHHTTAWTGRKTIEFLREHVRERGSGAKGRGAQPFFCWTSFIKPHPPLDPPAPWHRLYRPQDAPTPAKSADERAWLPHHLRWAAFNQFMDEFPDYNRLAAMWTYYYSLISFIDSWIGMILDELDALGLRENTVVVYTSDHGLFLGEHWSFSESSFYEPAAWVPLLLSWPAGLPAGVVRDQLVGLSDVVPTLLAAAGVDAASHGMRPDGTSLLPVARENAPTRDTLIGQVGKGAETELGAITREWKYIYSCADNRELLFPYRHPEQELVNHAVHPETEPTRAALRQAIIGRLRAAGSADLLDGPQTGFRLFPAPQSPTALTGDRGLRATARSWQYARWIQTLPDGWTPPPPSVAGAIPSDLPLRSDRSRYTWAPLAARAARA